MSARHIHTSTPLMAPFSGLGPLVSSGQHVPYLPSTTFCRYERGLVRPESATIVSTSEMPLSRGHAASSKATLSCTFQKCGLQDKACMSQTVWSLISKLPPCSPSQTNRCPDPSRSGLHRAQPSPLFRRASFFFEVCCPCLCPAAWVKRIIIVKGLLSVGLPVRVHLFHQFLGVVLGYHEVWTFICFLWYWRLL